MEMMKITNNLFLLGMTDEARERRWKWIDGSVVDQDTLGWDHNEPNGGRGENCAISWFRSNPNFLYTLNDLPCSYEIHYGGGKWYLKGQYRTYKPVVLCEKKC